MSVEEVKSWSAPTFTHSKYILVNDKFVLKDSNAVLTFEDEESFIVELGRYVEERIKHDFGFVEIMIPEDVSNDDNNLFQNHTSILASPDWISSSKMLMVVQNATVSILGVFSRTICLVISFYFTSI